MPACVICGAPHQRKSHRCQECTDDVHRAKVRARQQRLRDDGRLESGDFWAPSKPPPPPPGWNPRDLTNGKPHDV